MRRLSKQALEDPEVREAFEKWIEAMSEMFMAIKKFIATNQDRDIEKWSDYY